LQYVLPRWDGLVRYCENGALWIDNNLSERSVRSVAIGRKNYLFMGSDNGGTAGAVLYSIIASAKSIRSSRLPTCAICWSSYPAIRRQQSRHYCRTLGRRRTRNLAGAGHGRRDIECSNAKNLIMLV
jgi:hypothetical protein